MQCCECGGTYILKTDRYIFDDPFVGAIYVEGKPYYKCDKCNEILLTHEIIDAIEVEREQRKFELLSEIPIKDFISISETLKLLGITRQAFHKNQKIKRGFIYKVKIGTSTLYLKQSLDLFIKNGDGRFPLWSVSEYKEVKILRPIEEVYYPSQPFVVTKKPYLRKIINNTEEPKYVNSTTG
jgi:hypothetical protein